MFRRRTTQWNLHLRGREEVSDGDDCSYFFSYFLENTFWIVAADEVLEDEEVVLLVRGAGLVVWQRALWIMFLELMMFDL